MKLYPRSFGCLLQNFSAKSGRACSSVFTLKEHDCPGEEEVAPCVHNLPIDLPKIFLCKEVLSRSHVNLAYDRLLALFGEVSHMNDFRLTTDVGRMRTNNSLTRHFPYLAEQCPL